MTEMFYVGQQATTNVIDYEPAYLTVHPPPPPFRTAEGGFIFFAKVSSVPQKNVLKGKSEYFEVSI